MPILQLISAFLIGLILVYVSIPVIVRISKQKHLYDEPDEKSGIFSRCTAINFF